MISVCMICLNDEDFIQLSLKSVLRFADEVVLVDGGSSDKTLEKVFELEDERIKVFCKKWQGDYGAQRNEALKLASGNWVIQLDSDEVVCDSAGKYYKQASEFDSVGAFDVRMEHFIRDFGHVDNTHSEHWCATRFFKRTGKQFYSKRIHELVEGVEGKVLRLPKECVTYHLGYLRGIKGISEKYKKNVQEEAHTKEFLKWWARAHLIGEYPVKKFDIAELDSDIIKDAFFGGVI